MRQVSSWDTPQRGDVGASHQCMGAAAAPPAVPGLPESLAKKLKANTEGRIRNTEFLLFFCNTKSFPLSPIEGVLWLLI